MNRDLKIQGGRVEIFRVPLKEPFITAMGRQTETINVGFHLRLAGGVSGYGEASASIVNAHLKPGALAAALRRELKTALGKDARRLKALVSDCWRRNRALAPAAAAFECALTDALARSMGTSLLDWFGGALREIETDITLSASAPEVAANAARTASREGFRSLKVKVGTGVADDLRRVLAVRGAARGASILLDGNQGLTPSQALRLAEACEKAKVRVALFEQPVAREDLRGMAWLRRRSPFPIAADESARTAREAFEVLDRDAADVLNVKTAKTGLQESLEIVALARAAKKKLMIGCMRETSRGLSASASLACGTGAFKFVDLDSDHLLKDDRPRGDFRREGPRLRWTGRSAGPSRAGSPRRR